MKKIIYLLAVATIAVAGCKKDPKEPVVEPETDVLQMIPDPAFRAYCNEQMGTWDTNKNGKLSPEESAQVTEIRVRSLSVKIVSLEGIQHFPNLRFLECHSSELTSIDVSKNTALTTLICYNGKLTELNVSNNVALEGLGCGNNPITSLDISRNTSLTWLRCYENLLTELDVSKNTALTQLTCYGNQLTELDVSENTVLEFLVCYDNLITSIDLSKNAALGYLTCYSNQLTSLDISGNTALVSLTCWGNPGDGVSKFPVTAWFDNTEIPSDFSSSSWESDGKNITPDYRRAN